MISKYLAFLVNKEVDLGTRAAVPTMSVLETFNRWEFIISITC